MGLIWKNIRRQYTDVTAGYHGSVMLFECYHDAMQPKGTPATYALRFGLPGVAPHTTPHFDTLEQAKTKAESIFAEWCELAGLTPKEAR